MSAEQKAYRTYEIKINDGAAYTASDVVMNHDTELRTVDFFDRGGV